ncbi:hypothetical protein RIF29_07609 [Crotalaria pallida]|uniref:Uncharacterized protein n=1 Tax=Crotalaria pallida TaxID=3830 RepID=A0AAN9J5H5_CROPI
MRPSFVVSILLLSLLLLTKTQGIRLGKGSSLVVQQHRQHDKESAMSKKSNISDPDEEAILCSKDEQCTGKIKNRKLVTTSVSTTHTISKNVNNGGNEVHPLVNGNTRSVKVNGEANETKVNKMSTDSKNQQDQQHQEQYPDLVVDITEMDYSPPRRKTPIHN